ncbi:hypothetical protein SAMN04488128_101809 [Chitinophaga eiseniae]|uniref:Uncharacterized protein n=1 Tax=Chitinophaga eiseniae TaxID=634771 RepID=A0A1T4LUC8_9BACT|nr:hypothetical protein [Chitinophaga eiseniae]SJZ58302.1 hypothetical protein SAMN04488128_101809 [Chitinophaga eiseniae]
MSNEKTIMEEASQLPNDPDCTITITDAGPVPNYYTPNDTNIQDAINGISELVFTDIWRLPPFRKTSGSVNLMVWAVMPDGGRTWWITINGLDEANTIAAVNALGDLTTVSTQERATYIQTMTRAALVESVKTGIAKNVNGPCK